MRPISICCAAILLGLSALTGCDRKPEPPPAAAAGPGPAAAGAPAAADAPAAAAPAAPTVPAGPALRIAVVPKGTTHEYWKSIHAGAKQAERELGGIQVTFRGPEKEDDRDQQISLVQNLISAKYDAIVLAPLDDRALVAPVKQAAAAKIPVVIMDSGLRADQGTDYISFVATDNEKGGTLAGRKLGELLGGTGKVLLLRYQEGSASTALREKGFVDAIRGFKDIQLVDPGRYAGATRATAQEAAENLLAANTDIAGVFCPNESSTFGMMLALRSRGLAGKVKFIGFDASPELVDAMRKSEIHGLVVQNPIRMGYLAVKAAADHLRGQKVEARIDTGVGIVTPDSMDTPENKQLLSPDLKALLGS
ncbi:MAG: substrate-binding domain-containing protein [Phycisphaerales bacterium]|nr:substrate-binding domain-containing protein [Phycisphaerales bacterium]